MTKEFKKTVTFTESVSVTDGDGKVTFSADAGETVTLVVPSANRWIRRNKAVPGEAKPEQVEKPADDKKHEASQPSAPITATDDKKQSAPKKKAEKQKAAPKKQAD